MLYENLLCFNVDGRDVQYVIALDKHTGKTVWKTNRSVDYSSFNPNSRKAFCTPIILEAGGRRQLFSPGAKAMISYDPLSGEELWKIRYNGWSMAPRPLFGHGLVYVITDYDHPELWAVRPDGGGDVTDTHVAWKLTKDMPRTASLLLVDDLLCALGVGAGLSWSVQIPRLVRSISDRPHLDREPPLAHHTGGDISGARQIVRGTGRGFAKHQYLSRTTTQSDGKGVGEVAL